MTTTLPTIDWTSVSTAVADAPPSEAKLLYDWDYQDAAGCVIAAAERWLESDLAEYTILEIERTWRRPTHGTLLRGTTDLLLQHRDTGRRVIRDYKTKNSLDFDKEWDKRLIRSWQGRIYMEIEDADEIEFRGITRDTHRTRAITLRRNEYDGVYVWNYLNGTLEAMASLKGRLVWPQHRPSSCGAYGRECPFIRVCDSRTNMDHTTAPLIEVRAYSHLDDFLLCPERYRLSQSIEHEADSKETAFGSAVHRGMAALYEQFR